MGKKRRDKQLKRKENAQKRNEKKLTKNQKKEKNRIFGRMEYERLMKIKEAEKEEKKWGLFDRQFPIEIPLEIVKIIYGYTTLRPIEVWAEVYKEEEFGVYMGHRLALSERFYKADKLYDKGLLAL